MRADCFAEEGEGLGFEAGAGEDVDDGGVGGEVVGGGGEVEGPAEEAEGEAGVAAEGEEDGGGLGGGEAGGRED